MQTTNNSVLGLHGLSDCSDSAFVLGKLGTAPKLPACVLAGIRATEGGPCRATFRALGTRWSCGVKGIIWPGLPAFTVPSPPICRSKSCQLRPFNQLTLIYFIR